MWYRLHLWSNDLWRSLDSRPQHLVGVGCCVRTDFSTKPHICSIVLILDGQGGIHICQKSPEFSSTLRRENYALEYLIATRVKWVREKVRMITKLCSVGVHLPIKCLGKTMDRMDSAKTLWNHNQSVCYVCDKRDPWFHGIYATFNPYHLFETRIVTTLHVDSSTPFN